MNQKLINDLREGRIVLHNEPKNPEAVKEILKEAFPTLKFGEDFFKRETYALRGTDGLPKIPIAEFLRPEPRFKKGEKVCHVNNSNIFGYIDDMSHDGARWVYSVSPYSGVFKEEKICLAGGPGTIIESATKTGTEQQFEVGKQYEFSDDQDNWYKGKLLAIVDHKDKYIAGFEDLATGYTYIRPIQPKEITKEDLAGLLADWIELSDNAIVIGGSYLDVHENLYHKCKSILEQLKQQSC